MSHPIDDDELGGEPFYEDLLLLYRVMRPTTIACINVTDPTCLPLDVFLRGSRVWLVDWEAGRPEQIVARRVLQRDATGCTTCLAAELAPVHRVCASFLRSADHAKCAHFAPTTDGSRCTKYAIGREPRIAISDGSLGRATYFASRIEEVVAISATPIEAIERALVECERAARMDHAVDIATGSIELLISVLPSSRREGGPFAKFLSLMTRRFGPWMARASSGNARAVRELRNELFVLQIEGHIRELYRLVDKHVGGLYFATHPVNPAPDGSWSMPEGMARAFEVLTRYFTFDFDSFPPESFLRRARDKQVVQATLLRPLPRVTNTRGTV